MAWRESRGIWKLNCCILAKRSSMFSPLIGDNSGKKNLSTEPGTFWSSALHNPTVLLRSVQVHKPSSSVPQLSSDQWLHSHIPDFTSGSPTCNRSKSRWELSLWGTRVPLQDNTHRHCSPPTSPECGHISALPCPRAGQSCSRASHHCHPPAQPAKTTAALERWE